LKFDELFDTVLHCVSEEHLNGPDSHLGSLATGIPELGQFDIVIGNPPWTMFPGSDKNFLDHVAASAIQPLLSKEEIANVTNLVPRQAPDLAFLWKSLQWCRRGGAIGYLLDARLLFNVDHFEARRLLFTLLRVTGIVNATALRKERRVWPSHNKPFCALVAINNRSQSSDTFYYLNPHVEAASKVLGVIRLDPSAAVAIPVELVKNSPVALKVFSKGNAFDLNLIMRLANNPRIPMGGYVEEIWGAEFHTGYKLDGRVKKNASQLADLPCLDANDNPRFQVHASRLKTVGSRYPTLQMERPRTKEIYKGPLLLFREAPKVERDMRGAVWCTEDVVFSRSYYGLTAKSNPEGEYLFLLSYSDLFVYWSLLTSAKFGIERETIYLEDIRSFPITPFADLPNALRQKCRVLAKQIRSGECPWTELEEFVKASYRLSDLDSQLISDALEYASPYSQSLKRAAVPLNERSIEIAGFAEEIKESLDELIEDSFAVRAMGIHSLGDWLFVEISKSVDDRPNSYALPADAAFLASQMAGVKSFWTTQLRVQIGPNHWLIGQPCQARYWSKSKARLLALQLNEAGLFTSNLSH
jgi:hypothetical protein